MKFKRSENFYIRKVLRETKVKEIMVSPVITIPVGEPFSHVEEKFREHGIRHLPVVDAENNLIGIITQRDLYRNVAPRKLDDGNWYYDKEMLNQVILKNVMTRDPKTFQPNDAVADVLLEVLRSKHGCFPVVDRDGKLRGIVTQIDIMKIAAEILTEQPIGPESK